MPDLPLARTQELVVQKIDNELLIYDLRRNKAFCLNETSAMVWELCDGKCSVSQISDKMSTRLKTLVSEEYVWLAIFHLKKENLLDKSQMITSNFDMVSRRDLIKKIGFSSVIALPLISSIVAPSAVMAQSGCDPNGTACVDSSTCCASSCNNNVCCDSAFGSQPPGATQCQTDSGATSCSATELLFCCSGNAINNGQQACNVGEVECECVM